MFLTANSTDNSIALLNDLGIEETYTNNKLQLLAQSDGRFLKDMKINVSNALNTETLNKKETYLLALSVAVNEKNDLLQKAFTLKANQEGANEKEIAEVISCTSLLNANNVYYRFRHFMQEDFYTNAQAGIRMSIMANPILGKEFFELVSLVVSALNGCELCVTSHEQALIKHGTAKQRIHDAVRLGAVIKSLAVII